jgi:hypothetical protein
VLGFENKTNELSVPIYGRETLKQMSDNQLLNDDCVLGKSNEIDLFSLQSLYLIMK